MFVSDTIDIAGYAREDVAYTATAGVQAAVTVLDGIFDVLATTDCFLKVAVDPSDVTTATGYKLLANTVVPVRVPKGMKIGVIGTGAGTLSTHRVA